MEPARAISPYDRMYSGNDAHYFDSGRSALGLIQDAITAAKCPSPRRFLDYGAGAGRVTRWLRAAFPTAEIHACDSDPRLAQFLQQEIGVTAWTVPSDPERLTLSATYDVTWVGSVITHLPEQAARTLIERLAGASTLLICTFLGSHAAALRDGGEERFIDDAGWQTIKTKLAACGHGYADYDRPGYGVAVCSEKWIRQMFPGRIVFVRERAWGYQNAVAARGSGSDRSSL